MLELTRGANAPLPSATVTLSVACASAVDVSALLVGTSGKVRSDADLIFYNAPQGPGVTYLHPGPRGVDAVTVDTAGVPGDVEKVVVTASLDGSGPQTFAQAGSMVVTVLDAAGADAVRFELTDLTTEQALICAEVYRRNGEWKVRAVGQGYDDGLAGIATEFGIDVADDDEPALPPPIGAPAALPPPPGAPAAPALINLDKGTKISLKKHETISLVKTGAPPLAQLSMGLGWDPANSRRRIDLDASVIAFDANGRDLEKVSFMQKQAFGGAIRHSGDNLTGAGEGDDEVINVNLQALPPQVSALVFTVNSYSGQKFTEIRRAFCRLIENGTELVRYELTDSQASTGVLMCVMRRQADGTWTMTALGEYANGKTVKKMVEPARSALQRLP